MIKTPAKRGVDISLKFWQIFFFTRGIVPRFDPLMEGVCIGGYGGGEVRSGLGR
jgi:hypothetical protein